MRIAVLGRALPARFRHALVDAGLRFVPAGRADLRLHVGSTPPARAPKSPWLWVTPRTLDPAASAAAVLAGAYDVVELGDELPLFVQRRLAELRVRIEPTSAPTGFVARSEAARRVLDELDRVARTSMAVLLTGKT